MPTHVRLTEEDRESLSPLRYLSTGTILSGMLIFITLAHVSRSRLIAFFDWMDKEHTEVFRRFLIADHSSLFTEIEFLESIRILDSRARADDPDGFDIQPDLIKLRRRALTREKVLPQYEAPLKLLARLFEATTSRSVRDEPVATNP